MWQKLQASFRLLKQESYGLEICTSFIICRRNLNRSYGTKLNAESTKLELAVRRAEKVVGYPTSFLNLRWLLNDEVANIALHLRKLIGTNHPLLITAKNLFFSNQAHSWGLLVLLLSKAAGNKKTVLDVEWDATAGILHSQRVLSEVTEMIRTSVSIQKGILNFEKNQTDDVTSDMNYGNKVALLCGDYLLSRSFQDLANIKNQSVNEIMSSTLRDLAECEFLGDRDLQNNPLPSKPVYANSISSLGRAFLDEYYLEPGPYQIEKLLGRDQEEWVLRTLLGGANLLGKACQCTVLLGGHSDELQKQAYSFGKNLALAWQAKNDIESLTNTQEKKFSLVCLPILLQLKCDNGMYDEILKGSENIDNCDYRKIRNIIINSDAIPNAKEISKEYINRARDNLRHFPIEDANEALENIIRILMYNFDNKNTLKNF